MDEEIECKISNITTEISVRGEGRLTQWWTLEIIRCIDEG
jgi:hypothetical protein